MGDTGLRRQYTSTSKQRRHLKQTSSYQRIHLEGLDQYSETTNLKLATPMNRGMKSNMQLEHRNIFENLNKPS